MGSVWFSFLPYASRVSLLVVRDVAHQRTCPIDLFHQHQTRDLVRERHGREAQDEAGAFPDGVVETDVAPHDERDAPGLLDRQPLEPFRKLQRVHRLPALVEYGDVPPRRERGGQPRRMVADDSRIALALSTARRPDFHNLDRKEMPDPIQVTVDRPAELGVGTGTGPE